MGLEVKFPQTHVKHFFFLGIEKINSMLIEKINSMLIEKINSMLIEKINSMLIEKINSMLIKFKICCARLVQICLKIFVSRAVTLYSR